jgi:pyruvate ferredoxin oxidoreductase beta subunit
LLIASIERNHSSILLSRLAVETCYWPLYEVQDGKWTINYDPKDGNRLLTGSNPKGRFKYLFAPGNEALLAQFQKLVDDDWKSLKKLQKMSRT